MSWVAYVRWNLIGALFFAGAVKANNGQSCSIQKAPKESVQKYSINSRDELIANSIGKLANTYGQGISAYVSLADRREFLKPVSQSLVSISRINQPTAKIIDLRGAATCQQMSGFGFALTESTVLNINALEPRLRNDAMRALFDKTVGAGFNYLIVPLTSTDFNDPNLADFSVCDCKVGENIKAGCFNPERLAPTLQVLKEVHSLNPQLQLMLKPWTVPPHMKVSGSVNNSNPYFGGTYDSTWTPLYAKCLAQSVKYFEKNGFNVKSISAQNEPGLTEPYPSTYIDDLDHAKLLNALSKKLRAQGSRVQLIVRADNFNSAPNVRNEIEKLELQEFRPAFAAHCYSNDPQTPRILLKKGQARFCSTNKNREMDYLMGECTATARPDFNGDFNWWVENRLMGDIDLGATAVLAWNGLLDDNFGPKNHGCTQCRGLLSIDSVAGTKEVLKNPEYYALAHLSKFMQPGAIRLIHDAGLLAFKNPDSSFVVLLKNNSDENSRYSFLIAGGKVVNVEVPARSTMTVTLPKEKN